MGRSTSVVLKPLLRRGNAAWGTRRALELFGLAVGQRAKGTTVVRSIRGGVPVDIVSPADPDPSASIVYLHGGAYVSASVRAYRRLLTHLAVATGVRVIAVDYRLAPEHPFPAALEDATAVYEALLSGGSGEKIVVAGDSAGGGLAVATAVALRDRGIRLPAALVCISPWVDLTCSGDSMRTRAGRERMMSPAGVAADARRYAGGQNLRAPFLSPLFADLTGLPPMLIQVGDDEILFDDSTRLAQSARAADVPVSLEVWPRLWHVWHLYAGLMPEASAAMRQITDFIGRHLDPVGADE